MTVERGPGAPLHGDDRFYAALREDDPEELYEHAPCGYLSTLPDGTIVKVNQTLLSWTGYRRDDLVGRKRLQELLAPGDRIFYETHLAPLLALQGSIREIAAELASDSGMTVPVLINSVMKRDTTGTPTLIRTAIFDATERRSYERELLAARRHAEESEARATALARTLQESFLPPAVLAVPGLDTGGAYRPAGDGSEVGGDFYDVFARGHGSWAVVLGDVCGKGAAAAALTALARYTVRAEALRATSPGTVLTGLHEAILRYRPDDFCTAVFAVLEPLPEGVGLTLSCGGHPLPLRLRPDGTFDTLGVTDRLIGILDSPLRNDTFTLLTPGDLVVLYTDGVIEARRDQEFFDVDRLRDAINRVRTRAAQEIADHIVAAALDFQGGNARDDIAVLVLRAS